MKLRCSPANGQEARWQANTLCGYGCLASLPEGASGCTTVELKTNFLGAAREGKLTAAVFRCTQLVLWPRG
ncbi:Putative phenylacetic acid degradation-related protein [Mycobacteroides abscessus subsp. massiliense]|uniref:Putative phenylacetic acid degradation-related protein n=1 Tax=Mycobacteroides abscessus TaxID=36809 RepID=A0A0U0ZQH0_9MYCO|nr:Putative phenylacetic acid degradation-related protein [Mycobacteroides abscessus]SKM60758.1 thioesterase superfamily 10 domain protein [Mycobacteroides abscessus subsp. massiliense]SKW83309.1 thioesterase superfamily 10 domain protein [Mycobacteroides abscessus subsp. abscessus]SKN91712.1 thioesterase superfamily 10 domain protein [Mycobacteroides abscessus subsp. massiliense]SKP75371.1 Putative phenylacetic acid degradation-related protein [Mycobacteroides abscessus subsp. massiliense]